MRTASSLTATPLSELDAKANPTGCRTWDYSARLSQWGPRHSEHCRLLETIRSETSGRWSSYELREHLRKNGDRLMDARRREMDRVVEECNLCPGAGANFPDFKWVVMCDKTSCERRLVNPDGLGTGYELVDRIPPPAKKTTTAKAR